MGSLQQGHRFGAGGAKILMQQPGPKAEKL